MDQEEIIWVKPFEMCWLSRKVEGGNDGLEGGRRDESERASCGHNKGPDMGRDRAIVTVHHAFEAVLEAVEGDVGCAPGKWAPEG